MSRLWIKDGARARAEMSNGRARKPRSASSYSRIHFASSGSIRTDPHMGSLGTGSEWRGQLRT